LGVCERTVHDLGESTDRAVDRTGSERVAVGKSVRTAVCLCVRADTAPR